MNTYRELLDSKKFDWSTGLILDTDNNIIKHNDKRLDMDIYDFYSFDDDFILKIAQDRLKLYIFNHNYEADFIYIDSYFRDITKYLNESNSNSLEDINKFMMDLGN